MAPKYHTVMAYILPKETTKQECLELLGTQEVLTEWHSEFSF